MTNNVYDMWTSEIEELMENDKKDLIELLLHNDIIDSKSLYFKNFNPLLCSIYYNFSYNTIHKLINNGCNINEQNSIGWFPLYLAIDKYNKDIINLLLINKANINLQYFNTDITDKNNGKTPLHFAIENRYISIIDILLKNKCNVNIQDYNGNTPLHIICENNSIHMKHIKKVIIKKLLYYNSDIYIQNNNKKSPLQYSNQLDNKTSNYKMNIEKLYNDIQLEKSKKKLILYTGIHHKLGKNCSFNIIPFDLIQEFI